MNRTDQKIKYPDPGQDRKGRPVTRGRHRPLDRPLLERCLSGTEGYRPPDTANRGQSRLKVFEHSPREEGSSSESEQESIFKFRPPTYEQLNEQERLAAEHREWLHSEFGIPFPRHNMSRASNRPNHIAMPPAAMTRVSPNGSPGGTAPLVSPTSPRSGFLSTIMGRSRSRANTVTGRNSPRQEQADPMARAAAGRRDGGGVTRSVSTPVVVADDPAPAPAPTGPPIDPNGRTHRLRLVPNLENQRSLAFEPVVREMFPIEVRPGMGPATAAASIALQPLANNRPPPMVLKIGRYTDRASQQNPAEERPAMGVGGHTLSIAGGGGDLTNGKVAFKSKVVSRSHAEIWCDPQGKFWIRDTASSSGTFLNNIRLSSPTITSIPTQIVDGDVLQLGVDYQGGIETMFRCIRMRVEIGRDWQRSANEFNTNALRQLKALGGDAPNADAPKNQTPSRKKASVTDCCICLFSVTVCQSLFIAPCSHVFHYKCIRPLLQQHHPGFSCPLCRTFANLEEDVETEDAFEIASRRVSVISRRPSNHSIRLPRDDTRSPARNAPEGLPSSSIGFGSNAASVHDLLTADDDASGSNSETDDVHVNTTGVLAGDGDASGSNNDIAENENDDVFAMSAAVARHLSVAANIPIPASHETSRRPSSEDPERAGGMETAMDELQTPRNEYFLSSFSPMAMAAAHAGEPSMHQRLELAEQTTGQGQDQSDPSSK